MCVHVRMGWDRERETERETEREREREREAGRETEAPKQALHRTSSLSREIMT